MGRNHEQAILALEDGTVYLGQAFGASTTRAGEASFFTGMGGYQELLSDPASRGLILAMTYPHIGNTGCNELDAESSTLHASGLVVEEFCEVPSNWRSTSTLDDQLSSAGVPGIAGVDTRALTQRLREAGSLRAVLCTDGSLDASAAVAMARQSKSLRGSNLVDEVTTKQAYIWDPEDKLSREWILCNPSSPDVGIKEGADYYKALPPVKYRVIAYDYGISRSLLGSMRQKGFAVEVVDASTSADEVLSRNPDGILLSNGPGDPAALPKIHENIRALLGEKPILGVGLGHLLLAHALGADTHPLRVAHRGHHPVKNLQSGVVAITAQNQGFAVDENSLPSGVEVSYRNLNDGTVEGIRHPEHGAISVQYLPAANPPANNIFQIFEEFAKLIDQSR